jgi:hypothetical protein
MIRARELMVRLLRNPAVGPFVILLLAVALALLVIHEVYEANLESILAVCAVLASAVAVGFRLLRTTKTLPRPDLQLRAPVGPSVGLQRLRERHRRPFVLRL